MSDRIDRAAKVLWETSRRDEGTISATGAKIAARALAAAGLLATDEHEAEQQRIGAVRALREAVGCDHEDHETDVAHGGLAYVQGWLTGRANRIGEQP